MRMNLPANQREVPNKIKVYFENITFKHYYSPKINNYIMKIYTSLIKFIAISSQMKNDNFRKERRH